MTLFHLLEGTVAHWQPPATLWTLEGTHQQQRHWFCRGLGSCGATLVAPIPAAPAPAQPLPPGTEQGSPLERSWAENWGQTLAGAASAPARPLSGR